MLTELLEEKKALMAALDAVNADLHRNVSVYAVLETQDPSWPFDIRWIAKPGTASDDMKLINERLFDRAFLDYGFHEVLDENQIEGVAYQPIEELYADPDCIGCAPVSFFDDDKTVARMAHGADEDDDELEDLDAQRFLFFLKSVAGSVVDGSPSTGVVYDDVEKLVGLVFKYECAGEGGRQTVVAFQRVQRMWIQQKSSFLLFGTEEDEPFAFSDCSVKIGNSFDFVLYGQGVYFRSLKALEILFKYDKLVAQRAKDYADSFDPILADFEKLDQRIDESRTLANKLLKLQKEGSPVVDMSAEELQYHVNRIGYYSRKIKFNEDGKVMLTSNTDVSDFVKMLGDNFLVSPLSDAKYEARTKTRLDSDDI